VRHREPAPPIGEQLPENKLRFDPQVKKWVKRLTADPDARPQDLSDEQLAFVFREVLRQRSEP